MSPDGHYLYPYSHGTSYGHCHRCNCKWSGWGSEVYHPEKMPSVIEDIHTICRLTTSEEFVNIILIGFELGSSLRETKWLK